MVLFSFSFETKYPLAQLTSNSYIAEARLELLILPPLPPEAYKCAPPHFPRVSLVLGKHSPNRATSSAGCSFLMAPVFFRPHLSLLSHICLCFVFFKCIFEHLYIYLVCVCVHTCACEAATFTCGSLNLVGSRTLGSKHLYPQSRPTSLLVLFVLLCLQQELSGLKLAIFLPQLPKNWDCRHL